MNKKDLQKFEKLLLEKRKRLIENVGHLKRDSMDKTIKDNTGDISSYSYHMADMGTDNFEQEFSLGLLDSERNMLVDIVHALNKIDVGRYGICEGTGKMIIKPRLEANPWAKYCIEYATMVEKGLIIEGERVEDFEEEYEDVDLIEVPAEEDDYEDDEKSVYDLFEDDDEKEKDI